MPSKRTASNKPDKTTPTPKKAAATSATTPVKPKVVPKAASVAPAKASAPKAAPPPTKAPPPKSAPSAAQSPLIAAKRAPIPRPDAVQGGEEAPGRILARAEADLTVLLESLNNQMSAAMHAMTDLAIAQKGGDNHDAVIRTRPLDRATAMFQRLVAELMDERLAELLPTIVNLRNEMDQRLRLAGSDGEQGEFLERGRSMLDQVLAAAEVHTYQPRTGDPYDPLIHLAVGETFREELADGVVSEVFQPGFRSARGKIVVPARVKVNRR